MRQNIFSKNFDDETTSSSVYIAVDNDKILFLCYSLSRNNRDDDLVCTPTYTVDQIQQFLNAYQNHQDVCINQNQLQLQFYSLPNRKTNKTRTLTYINSCNVDSDCPFDVELDIDGIVAKIIDSLYIAIDIASANSTNKT